jgi:peptidylprolyl isomerase
MQVKWIMASMVALSLAGCASSKNKPPKPVIIPPSITPAATPENTLLLDLDSGGEVAIQLRPDKAPNSVERIKTLVHRGFYNGLTFHRVIDGFMAQGGDPKGDGTGGSDLPDLKAEFNDLPHMRGMLAMARAASPDSANSQFFIMLQPNFSLDEHYTVVGRVLSGMQYVDAIQKGEPPANPTHIVRASIQADNLPPLPASVLQPPPPKLPAADVTLPSKPAAPAKLPAKKPRKH